MRLTQFQKSLLLSILIWFGAIFVFSYSADKKLTQPQSFIEIDAQLIGEARQARSLSENPQQNDDGLEAKKESTTESKSENKAQKQLVPLAQPLPEIPADLKKEAFSSRAVARFYIRKNGEVAKVELIKPSVNNKLNELLIKSLEKWRFQPFGDEVANDDFLTQEIRVNFSVEED
jgi:TonB family protein